MIRIRTFLFFILITGCAFGQEVLTIEQDSNYVKKEDCYAFHYIDKDFSLSRDVKIASLKGTCFNNGEQSLVTLFNTFWSRANFYGANSFRIDSITYLFAICTIYISIH